MVGFVFPAYESFRAIEEGSEELGKIWSVRPSLNITCVCRVILVCLSLFLSLSMRLSCYFGVP